MKNKNIIITIILFLSPFIFVSAQIPNAEEKIKDALQTIFKLSLAKDYEVAAQKIAYSGEIESRNLKEAFNYKDSKESNEVKRYCRKIKAYLDLSDSYDFKDFKTKNDNGSVSYNINVDFKSGQQSLTIEFKFVDAGGKLLLAEFK